MRMTVPSWLTSDRAREHALPPGLATPILVGPTVYIYGLKDPETDLIRYIGKSIRPVERLGNHMSQQPTMCHRSHWLQSLKRRGLQPELVILERIEGAWPWQESERFWIKYARQHGWPLTNNTDGGDGVDGLPPETRARMAAVWRGRKHRPESIEKLKIARRLRVTKDSTRAKMSATMKGRVITWGDKLSEANRKLSAEQEADVLQRLNAGEKVTHIAAELGMHRASISKIKKGTYRVKRKR